MTNTSTSSHGPQDILLATDLSIRADRAEARAVERAAALQAKLHVVTVIEPDRNTQPADVRMPDPQSIEADLRRSYGSDFGLEVTAEAGKAWPVIIREATAHNCALIVLGPADPCGLQEKLLGSTAERVIHAAPVPVLSVRRRAYGPYLQVVVATDFSANARHALVAAAGVLPEAEFLLVHAYRVPFAGFLSRESNEQDVKRQAEDDMGVFLASLDSEPQLRGRVGAEVIYGTPDEVFGAYVLKRGVELVVMGAHGTGGAFDKILGGTAERLLSQLPCDVMVSRMP